LQNAINHFENNYLFSKEGMNDLVKNNTKRRTKAVMLAIVFAVSQFVATQ